MSELITGEKIRALPTLQRVAFTVRCAERLHPLFELPDETPDREHHMWVVEKVLELAREFAEAIEWRGEPTTAQAKVTSIVYSEMAKAAKDLSTRSIPRAIPFHDYRALAKTYELASDYLVFAVAALELQQDLAGEPEYQDDSAYVDYAACARWWHFEVAAINAAVEDYNWLAAHTKRRHLPEAVDSDFFDRPLWPRAEPEWGRITTRHRRAIASLGKTAFERTILEAFDGFVDLVEEDTAYVTLRSQSGETLHGRYSASELSAKGIHERRRFRCTTVDVAGAVRIEFEGIPEKEVSAEREREIRSMIDRALRGDEVDDE